MEVLSYTRMPKEDMVYSGHMALSMHLAYKEEGVFYPFHHNEGILYAKAVHREDGTMEARSLKSPWLFRMADKSFGVLAVRTLTDGADDPDSEGCVLFFSSRDLVHYEEKRLLRIQEKGFVKSVRCVYDLQEKAYHLSWELKDSTWKSAKGADLLESCMRNDDTETCVVREPVIDRETCVNIEGVCPCSVLQIEDKEADYLKRKLLVPVCVGMKLSAQEPFSSRTELERVQAVAEYSDGTSVARRVDWGEEKDGVVQGRVHQEHFPTPFAENRADPVCMYRNGKYYFIATNDADGNHTLYMRCAETLGQIADAPETLFLDSGTYPGIGGLLWAPEFHEIGGRLYVFHAATPGEFYCEESHVRILREGGDPMCREDWSAPILVVRKDGSPLCEGGSVISLDMTTFGYGGKVYAMWSQRQFLPVDQGAWLYLAQIDEREPWRLVSDPVCIAKPEYGWENNHTYVVEGPYALYRDGQLMVTYAAAAVDATYTVGLLKPVMGSDILDPGNWVKNNYPLLSQGSVEGEYGPGHNSYLTDEDGLTWNFYHMRPGVEAPRCAAARRVHFDIDGEPVLDLTEKADLPEEFRRVTARIDGSR